MQLFNSKNLGPLLPLGAFFALFALIFALNRVGLYFANQGEIAAMGDAWKIFPVGLRMDTIILCQALVAPVVILFFINTTRFAFFRRIVTLYLSAIAMIFVFMEIATWPFLNEFGSRPNQLFFIYFTHPKEVLGTLWAEHKLVIFFATGVLIATAVTGWKMSNRMQQRAAPWPWFLRLISFPVVAALLLLGARSGVGEAVANPSLAAFSNNHLANQIALNSSYSLAYSVYLHNSSNSLRAGNLYGELSEQETLERIKKATGIPGDRFTRESIPTLHTQTTHIASTRPRNLVIIVMESMGADFVGHLGGLPLTPSLDALAEKGIRFNNLYAIGQRTHRGMEALLSGYLPTSKGSSIMRLDLAQNNFFTIGALLKKHGYQTSFIYNGESHFDGMSGFMLGNGFDVVVDESDFREANFRGTWGVSDEDLFDKAHRFFSEQKEPFLSVILTLSNHIPFEFPEGKIELYEQPANTPHNSAKYADYAIGEFFSRAANADYFNNTVFVLVADHPMRIRSSGLVPVERFRIPGLILAPDLQPKTIDEIASQIDIAPTALGLLGLDLEHPMIGRDWLDPDNVGKSHAVMLYDQSHTYRVGNQVIVHQPRKPPQQFIVNNTGELVETQLDESLRRDALAHALFPGLAYQLQQYKLP